MALRLRELGYSNAFALQGGYDAWVKAGYPTEPKGRAEATEAHQPL